MFDEKLSAISICLFDPTGAANRRNVPASVWDWRDGRKHRKQRSDSGTGIPARERQARHRSRVMSQDKQNLPIENTTLAGANL